MNNTESVPSLSVESHSILRRNLQEVEWNKGRAAILFVDILTYVVHMEGYNQQFAALDMAGLVSGASLSPGTLLGSL